MNAWLPHTFDNTYRGHKMGLWLLALVLAVKFAQITALVLDPPGIVASADGVSLDAFSPAATQTVLAAFLGMAVSRLLITALCALALWRYRRAVPPLFVLLALHDVAREIVLAPIRTETQLGAVVNGILVVMTLIGVGFAAVNTNVGRVGAAQD